MIHNLLVMMLRVCGADGCFVLRYIDFMRWYFRDGVRDHFEKEMTGLDVQKHPMEDETCVNESRRNWKRS